MDEVEKIFDKKWGEESTISVNEFFESKFEGKLTENQKNQSLDKLKKEIELRKKWQTILEEIYLKKGLFMTLKQKFEIPVYTLENLANMRQDVIDDDMYIGLFQGNPASGKSTTSICLIACGIDESFDHSRISFTREECLETLRYIRNNITLLRGKGCVFVFDEGTEALFGGDGGNKMLKEIIKTLSVIREANIILLINSTSIRKIAGTIRDEYIRFLIRTPKKGQILFYNKQKIDLINIPTRGAVKYPKPSIKEYTPKIEGLFWDKYRKLKHKSLGDNNTNNKGINTYEDVINILGIVSQPLERLILLLYQEGFGYKEMIESSRDDYDPQEGIFSGRNLREDTIKELNYYLTFVNKNKRVRRILPKMSIKDLEILHKKIIKEFEKNE